MEKNERGGSTNVSRGIETHRRIQKRQNGSMAKRGHEVKNKPCGVGSVKKYPKQQFLHLEEVGWSIPGGRERDQEKEKKTE